MNGLQGKAVNYVHSDGGWENVPGKEDPGYETAKLSRKYNVCSRVITFDFYISHPYCLLEPLYYTNGETSFETTSEK